MRLDPKIMANAERLRRRKGISYDTLADRISKAAGKSPPWLGRQVQRWLKGERKSIRGDSLKHEHIAEALGVPLSRLIGRRPDRNPRAVLEEGHRITETEWDERREELHRAPLETEVAGLPDGMSMGVLLGLWHMTQTPATATDASIRERPHHLRHEAQAWLTSQMLTLMKECGETEFSRFLDRISDYHTRVAISETLFALEQDAETERLMEENPDKSPGGMHVLGFYPWHEEQKRSGKQLTQRQIAKRRMEYVGQLRERLAEIDAKWNKGFQGGES